MDEHTKDVMFGSASGEYGTPRWVYEPMHEAFKFTLDAASSDANHKTPWYLTEGGLKHKTFSTPYVKNAGLNGLTPGTWDGSNVWCNPPYGRGISAWARQAAFQHDGMSCLLLPARTETDWFQRWVFPYAYVCFLMGRVTFLVPPYKDENGAEVFAPASAPFPSVLALYGAGPGYSTLDLKSGPVPPHILHRFNTRGLDRLLGV